MVPPQKIRIIIADDHSMVRQGLRAWIDFEEDFELVREIVKGRDILGAVLELKPDVVVTDLHFPDANGADAISEIRALGIDVPILVMTGYEKQRARHVLSSGANGFINKEESRERVIEAIRWAAKHEPGRWLSPDIAEDLMQSETAIADAELTKTDLRILSAIQLSNSQMAEKLCLSEGTIKNHISTIYSKINVTSRQDAVAWAKNTGLLEP